MLAILSDCSGKSQAEDIYTLIHCDSLVCLKQLFITRGAKHFLVFKDKCMKLYPFETFYIVQLSSFTTQQLKD